MLVADGSDIQLTPDAEEKLIQLLDIQAKVEEAVKTVKANLEQAGLEIDPNFKSAHSDKIRIGYRYFGSQYAVDESRVSELPTEVYETKTSYSVNKKGLDAYLKQHESLPLGIVEKDRKKTITITRLDVEEGGSDGE